MSANAPSDDAWAQLSGMVAELQAKVATLESEMKVAQENIEALELDVTDPTPDSRITAIVQYLARRDDISESKVC